MHLGPLGVRFEQRPYFFPPLLFRLHRSQRQIDLSSASQARECVVDMVTREGLQCSDLGILPLARSESFHSNSQRFESLRFQLRLLPWLSQIYLERSFGNLMRRKRDQ